MSSYIKESPTKIVVDSIKLCKSEEELANLIKNSKPPTSEWKKVITDLSAENALKVKKVEKALDTSNETARRVLNNIPGHRDNIIMLAAMMHLNVEETNELLTRYTGYSGLYAKDISDFIWIYILNNGGTDTPIETFNAYYDEVISIVFSNKTEMDSCSTKIIKSKILDAKDKDTFLKAVEESVGAFYDAYLKLVRHMENLLEGTPNSVLKSTSLRNRFYDDIGKLSCGEPIKGRSFIIAFGLVLNLSIDQINELFEMAYMRPLCSVNNQSTSLLESAVYFYIEEWNANGDKALNGTGISCDNLADYVRIRIESSKLDFDEKEKNTLVRLLTV